MHVFISYSFEDQSDYENVTDALDDEGLEYWKTADTRSGELLSKQLREAISRSAACIFIATRRSVSSAWCGAELGAFWGADKPVLIFLADKDLKEADLPRQFQGHFLQRRIKKLMADCKHQVETLRAATPAEAGEAASAIASSYKDLLSLVEGAIARVTSSSLVATAFLQLESRSLPSRKEGQLAAEASRMLSLALQSFLGLSRLSVEQGAALYWPYSFVAQTTTGSWHGYAKTEDWESYNYIQSPCIFFKYDDRYLVEAVCICQWFVEFDRGGEALGPTLASTGSAQLGALLAPPPEAGGAET